MLPVIVALSALLVAWAASSLFRPLMYALADALGSIGAPIREWADWIVSEATRGGVAWAEWAVTPLAHLIAFTAIAIEYYARILATAVHGIAVAIMNTSAGVFTGVSEYVFAALVARVDAIASYVEERAQRVYEIGRAHV